jgi:septum formation protein
MIQSPPKLILASRSPRRRELLAAAGYAFEIVPPSESAECGLCGNEAPIELVARLAYQKAADVARKISARLVLRQFGNCGSGATTNLRSVPGLFSSAENTGGQATRGTQKMMLDRRLVLGCDTVAECNGQILGKPANEDDARRMLQTLSGRRHRVLSGLCLWPVPDGQPMVRTAITLLEMDVLSERQLDDYLDGGLWEGKAGAFGYQDGIDWVHVIEGSESNVVGLPMELLAEMLGTGVTPK